MALNWRRILLGPGKLRWWSHLVILAAWSIFCFGFAGVTAITLTAVPLLYLISISGFYLAKGVEKIIPALWQKLKKKE